MADEVGDNQSILLRSGGDKRISSTGIIPASVFKCTKRDSEDDPNSPGADKGLSLFEACGNLSVNGAERLQAALSLGPSSSMKHPSVFQVSVDELVSISTEDEQLNLRPNMDSHVFPDEHRLINCPSRGQMEELARFAKLRQFLQPIPKD